MQKYKILNAYPYNRADNHPSIAIIYLLFIVLVSGFVFSLMGMVLGMSIYNVDMFHFATGGLGQLGDKELNYLSVVQIFSAIGTFIVPAFLMNWIQRNKQVYFNLKFEKDGFRYLLVILLMVFFNPFFEWTIMLNEQMKLPVWLKSIEEWMRTKEDQTEILTQAFLSRQGIDALLTNLFMVGFLAAFGEELLFRGCIQQILIRWLGRIHLAIWITAIIFSAIHLQFYGFIPRMLIGALCGYLYFYGKSIWFAILAHFVNNASAILFAYYLTSSGKSLDDMTLGTTTWYWALASLLIGMVILYYFRKRAIRSISNHEDKDEI